MNSFFCSHIKSLYMKYIFIAACLHAHRQFISSRSIETCYQMSGWEFKHDHGLIRSWAKLEYRFRKNIFATAANNETWIRVLFSVLWYVLFSCMRDVSNICFMVLALSLHCLSPHSCSFPQSLKYCVYLRINDSRKRFFHSMVYEVISLKSLKIFHGYNVSSAFDPIKNFVSERKKSSAKKFLALFRSFLKFQLNNHFRQVFFFFFHTSFEIVSIYFIGNWNKICMDSNNHRIGKALALLRSINSDLNIRYSFWW